MKVTITTLKAPWPEGAKVGDVVRFPGDHAPAWAVGKFKPAAQDAEVNHKYAPPEIKEVPDVTSRPVEVSVQQMASAQAFLDDLRAKHDEQLADLRKQVDGGGKTLQDALDANQVLSGELETAKADADAQRRLVTDLQAKLVDAEKALAAAKPKGNGK